MRTPILLDVSRLLAQAQRGAPTGIDRVELAYAEQLLRLAPERLQFVVIDLFGRPRCLPGALARRFVARLGAAWQGEGPSPRQIHRAARLLWLQAALRPGCAPSRRRDGEARALYLLVSHRNLERPNWVARALAESRSRLVVCVQDLIPIQYPEYARPQQADTHLRRVQTVTTLADAVLVTSSATRMSLQPYLDQAGRAPPVLRVPLGVPPGLTRGVQTKPAVPYFVCLSTIEPRKNHLLLLNVWRRLVETLGDAAPRLVLVGRIGWEVEMVMDILQRCVALRPFVEHRSEITDAALAELLHGCRALLYPTFAEGFGLPLVEALAARAPAIASDIPVLRETGGVVPEYVDPLDGPGWLAMIRAYAKDPSPERDAQLARIAETRPSGWPEHMQAVLAFLDATFPEASAG